jgi:putative membrane protein
MAEADFFLPETKAKVAQAIREVESQTSAELEVAVRRSSGHGRLAAQRFAALVTLGVLCLLLFHPRTFKTITMPFDVVIVYVLSTWIASKQPGLRRLLARNETRTMVKHCAQTAFLEMGVHRTQRRGGILIYVSLLERDVEVVADWAVEAAKIEGWNAAVDQLRQAVSHRADADAFVGAIKHLGPMLAKALPHQVDDVNELSDEMSTG